MKIDYLDVDAEQLTPGWIPEGWEKGEPLELRKDLNTFVIKKQNGDLFQFNNSRLPEFFTWLEWWNDD